MDKEISHLEKEKEKSMYKITQGRNIDLLSTDEKNEVQNVINFYNSKIKRRQDELKLATKENNFLEQTNIGDETFAPPRDQALESKGKSMTIVVFHEGCMHSQYILLNCDSYEDASLYSEKAQKRGTCKLCGCKLGQLSLVVMEDREGIKLAKGAAEAIDMKAEKRRQSGDIKRPWQNLKILLFGRSREHNSVLKAGKLAHSGDNKKALKKIEKVLKSNPHNAEATYIKAWSLERLGKVEEALKWYDDALSLDEDNEKYWNDKGTSLLKLNRNQEALTCFERSLKINPRYMYAWNNKGTIFFLQQKYQKALNCYERALEVDPDKYADGWFGKAIALEKLGELSKAIQSFKGVLEIDPLHSRRKEIERALVTYRGR